MTPFLALALSGCFIPVSFHERASPPIFGVLRHSDGTPATGARVAVVGSDYGATPCKRPLARATVDSAGTFGFAGTTRHVRWVMIVPPFERFNTSYSICVGASDSSLGRVYRGISSLDAKAPGDSLECLLSEWQDDPRVTCAKFGDDGLVSGGQWTHGTTRGYFRLVRIEVGPLKGPEGTRPRPRYVVQWVGRVANGRDSVHAQVAIPAEERLRSLQRLWDPSFHVSGTRLCLSVVSDRYRHFGSGEERLWFVLGVPGDIRPLAHC